ncbi:Synaptonemal complex protein SC65-like [Oopsacas minuta]|uniref:Synaptonemal complex protein SC65-like n=1 Tax=Oopsacas minuta TaxID=111878 RepID=A0AAV7KLD7_9METZ|nr:Synaptonemal complex protein SC65-like [Oopsacas minuta]
MKLSFNFCIISLSLLYNAFCWTDKSPPMLSTHFSARMRPSKIFENTNAAGLSSLIFMNLTKYDTNDDLMISEIDSIPSNESHILYQSYMNGREKKAYFIYEGECYTENIDDISPGFYIVPSFISLIFINFFNEVTPTLTHTLKECTYHKSVDCEGWTAVDTDGSKDNITVSGYTGIHLAQLQGLILQCKAECLDKIETVEGVNIKNLLGTLLGYIQYCYFRNDQIEEGYIAAITWRALDFSDHNAESAVDYYLTETDILPMKFIPIEEYMKMKELSEIEARLLTYYLTKEFQKKQGKRGDYTRDLNHLKTVSQGRVRDEF